jgi:hypothetical protein
VSSDLIGLTPTTIQLTGLPEGFWQSEPCASCGAAVGVPCRYPSGRVAHTRHAPRDAAVKAAAAAAAINAARARLGAAGYA